MIEWFSQWMPNVVELADEFPISLMQTMQMLVITGVISFVFGLLFAVILVVTKKGGILENRNIIF